MNQTITIKDTITHLVDINEHVQNIVDNMLNKEQDTNSYKSDHGYGPEVDWQNAYGLIFHPQVSTAAFEALKKIGNNLDYYEPDTTYKEDILAFAQALNEKVNSLQNLTQKRKNQI